jgi:hypothetical protein
MGSSFNTKMMKALQAVARPNRETNMNSAQITQMILEADEFSLGLNEMIKTLSNYSSAANGEGCFLNTEKQCGSSLILSAGIISRTKASCSAALPRVWMLSSDDLNGRAVPQRHNLSLTDPTIVGGDFNFGLLEDSIQLLSVRAPKIIAPLSDWILTHQHVKARIARLEKLGRQIEASLRTSKSSLFSRRQERDIREEEEGSILTEFVADEIKIEERKHEALIKTWEENEKSITEQLTALIIDSSYCKSVVLSLFIAIKESVQASLLALGPCKHPLPGYSSPTATEHGEVLGNDELIHSMPVGNVEASSSVSKFGPPASAITTRRVTASPLQIATSAAPTPRYAPVGSAFLTFDPRLNLIEKQDDEKELRRTD